MTSSEIPEDLASVARSMSAPERLPAQAGTSKIAPRVAVDDLFRRVPGQSSPPTLIQRVHAALPILRSYHTGGVVTLITTNVGFSGTRDHPFIHARLDWSISVVDQRGFGRGYSTIDSHGIADLAAQADARNIRRGLPSRLPSFVDPQPRVFTVDEGPAPGLLDSDTAYEIAEAGGGATVRSTTGVQLESAALTTRLRESAPLWAFRYGDDANPDRLIVIPDALNGDVQWTGAPTAGQ